MDDYNEMPMDDIPVEAFDSMDETMMEPALDLAEMEEPNADFAESVQGTALDLDDRAGEAGEGMEAPAMDALEGLDDAPLDAGNSGLNVAETTDVLEGIDEPLDGPMDDAASDLDRYTLHELETLRDSYGWNEGDPDTEQIAGAYKEIRGSEINGETGEAHHIMPKSIIEGDDKLETTILLEKDDHRELPTTGGRINSKHESFLPDSLEEGLSHKDAITELVDDGRYAEAYRNEVLEIRKQAFDNSVEEWKQQHTGETDIPYDEMDYTKYDGAIRDAVEHQIAYVEANGTPRSKGAALDQAEAAALNRTDATEQVSEDLGGAASTPIDEYWADAENLELYNEITRDLVPKQRETFDARYNAGNADAKSILGMYETDDG